MSDPQASATFAQAPELSGAFAAKETTNSRKLTDPVIRANLVKALVEGKNPEELARAFGCSPQAIRLFRAKHVRPALAIARANYDADTHKLPAEARTNSAVKLAETGAAVAEHVSRIRRHYGVIDKQLSSETDSKALASLIGTDLKAIELNAKLDGSLTTTQVTDNSINIAMLLSADQQQAPALPQLAQAEFTDDPELG